MNPTQLQRQTVLAEYLAAAISAFLATHPDTELATILRALDDAKTDADVTIERAMA